MTGARPGTFKKKLLGIVAAAAVITGGVIATNSAGASETHAHGANAVPAHAVTGYWQDFSNGAKVQKLADVPDNYDIIAVAFANATSTPGAVDFSLDPSLGYGSVDDFKADIKAKQAAGKSVVISVGGQNGSISVTDDTSATNFANSIVKLMNDYGFDGVDIDLENGINSTYMTKALTQIHDQKSNAVITMAPQTVDMQSTGTEYFKTALAIKDFLTEVNTQYYNSGSMNGCDGKVYSQGSVDFITSQACIELQGGLAPSQVGLGVPASPQAAGSGYVDPSVVNNALDCLAKGTGCGSFKPDKTYPDLRGAMTWSTNWDASNNNAFASQVGDHVHGL